MLFKFIVVDMDGFTPYYIHILCGGTTQSVIGWHGKTCELVHSTVADRGGRC